MGMAGHMTLGSAGLGSKHSHSVLSSIDGAGSTDSLLHDTVGAESGGPFMREQA